MSNAGESHFEACGAVATDVKLPFAQASPGEHIT